MENPETTGEISSFTERETEIYLGGFVHALDVAEIMLKKNGGDVGTIDLLKMLKRDRARTSRPAMQAHDAFQAWMMMREIVESEEGASVEFTGPNPDPGPQPNECVQVTASFTGWEAKDYRADTIVQCLEAAIAEMKAAGQ